MIGVDDDSTPLLQLRDPLPPVTDTAGELRAYCRELSGDTGPVAIDAERASGFRYSHRAYLVQLRRGSAGTALVDPIAFDDLGPVNDAIGSAEWILHAATQDLPCLRGIGLQPHALFDTELAGRLLGYERVGLASLTEEFLGLRLAKEHSAVDWSTRPLPSSWLSYAALDVEPLIELRDILDDRLQRSGKREWAQQEFDALLTFTGHTRTMEQWRRTSGIHKVHDSRGMAIIRSVWTARDDIACNHDTAPRRILADSAIIEMARESPASRRKLRELQCMRARGPRRFLDDWYRAVLTAQEEPDDELPPTFVESDDPPPPRVWSHRKPAAADRLGACKQAITELATKHDVPSENLMPPHAIRRLAWDPPDPLTVPRVAEALLESGARQWQSELTSTRLARELVI